MDGLELETAVDEIEPWRAIDIHGGTELSLWKALGITQVGSRHGPMREGYLHVQWHSDDVRYQDESHTKRPGRDSAPKQAIAEDEPVAEHESNLRRSSPRCGAKVCRSGREKMKPGEDVEIESCDTHDWVVSVALVLYRNVREFVPSEGEVVVAGMYGFEK